MQVIYNKRPSYKTEVQEESKYDTLVFGANQEKLSYTFSKCCNPIPGDDVFGFTTIREGVKIHRRDCPNAIRLQSNFAYRILESKWINNSNKKSDAVLHIKGIDRVGLINEITQILSNNLKVNIKSININSSDGTFDGLITVRVIDKQNLNNVINNIKKVDGVISINRKFKSS